LYADLSHVIEGKKSGEADLALNSSGKVPDKHESDYAEIIRFGQGKSSEEERYMVYLYKIGIYGIFM